MVSAFASSAVDRAFELTPFMLNHRL